MIDELTSLLEATYSGEEVETLYSLCSLGYGILPLRPNGRPTGAWPVNGTPIPQLLDLARIRQLGAGYGLALEVIKGRGPNPKNLIAIEGPTSVIPDFPTVKFTKGTSTVLLFTHNLHPNHVPHQLEFDTTVLRVQATGCLNLPPYSKDGETSFLFPLAHPADPNDILELPEGLFRALDGLDAPLGSWVLDIDEEGLVQPVEEATEDFPLEAEVKIDPAKEPVLPELKEVQVDGVSFTHVKRYEVVLAFYMYKDLLEEQGNGFSFPEAHLDDFLKCLEKVEAERLPKGEQGPVHQVSVDAVRTALSTFFKRVDAGYFLGRMPEENTQALLEEVLAEDAGYEDKDALQWHFVPDLEGSCPRCGRGKDEPVYSKKIEPNLRADVLSLLTRRKEPMSLNAIKNWNNKWRGVWDMNDRISRVLEDLVEEGLVEEDTSKRVPKYSSLLTP